MGPNPRYRTITGIARDVRTELAVEPEPMMYLPYRQLLSTNTMTLVVRGTAGANQGALVEAIRAAVRGIDPALPVFQPRTMGELAARQIAPWRFSMLLLTSLAVLAALLAAVGLAAVITFNVAQRTAEIGMRVVLGASRPQVAALVLGGMMKAVGVGLAIGSMAALWGGTLLTTQLYRVHPRDPAAMAAALVALTIVAMAATWPAVRRAWRIDPLAAIRD
jgi:ABC-type antimicrobial peptide transport system permease subunit